MKRIVAAALALSLAFPAGAQEGRERAQDGRERSQEGREPAQEAREREQEVLAREPPPPEEDAQRRPPMPSETGYLDGCFGTRRTGVAPVGVYGEVPIPLGDGTAHSAPELSGLKDEKAWLVVAVVAAMALPVVIYALDRPALRVVLQRFRCPSMAFDLQGGADNGQAALGRGASGFASARLTLGAEHVGADLQYDAAPGAVSAFATHLLLRATPRDHVEGAIAIGYRRAVLGDRLQGGLEVGLPHRYALWRDGLQTVALEVRPLLLVGTRVEPSLEAAFLLPLADVLQARASGRVYTFAGDLRWGLSLGLSFTL